MKSRAAAALVLAIASLTSAAHAQATDPPTDPPADPPKDPVPSDRAVAPANQPNQPNQPNTFRPPSSPGPVPDPSPVVLGGYATSPDTVGKPLVWRRARFSTADYVITAAGGALTLASAIIKPSSAHNLQGPILFDNAVRKSLRPDSLDTRYAFRDASDVGLSIAVTWPFFIDALATAWWYRGSRDTAQEMALLGLETLAVSGAVQGVTNVFVGRERPYGENCGTDQLPSNAIDCTSNSHYRSFFSGHSSFAFTGAALVCFNHFENELLGGPWDAVSCATVYAFAATTATFRVVSDVHYASDVITGALMGTLVGYGVPLLHRRYPDINTVKTTGVTMKIVPMGTGAGVVGSF